MAARTSFVAKATGFALLAFFNGGIHAQNTGTGIGHTLLAVNSTPDMPKTRTAVPVAAVPSSVMATLTAKTTSVIELKPSHLHALTIQRGVLTVDGLTAKVNLNYQIDDLRYLYLYVPGVGTTVISDVPFAGALAQKDAFDGDTLTVRAGGSRLQLTAEHRMLGKRAAFVKFDPNFGPSSRMPMMGYGDSAIAPYAWPGALKETNVVATVHPVPVSMKPNLQRQTTCSASLAPTPELCTTAVMTVAYRHER